MPNVIHLGTDHAGFELKETIKDFLERNGYQVTDHGAHEYEEDDDYVDYVVPVAREVGGDPESKGIILGGSGQGEAITANRFHGVRAVVFNGQYDPGDGRDIPHEVVISREHNNANILSLGARFLNEEEALEAVEQWLETEFSYDERHVRRLQKLDQIHFDL